MKIQSIVLLSAVEKHTLDGVNDGLQSKDKQKREIPLFLVRR
jgi:hypothetical protein